MCGIVGLLIKRRELRESLGQMVTPMLDCMGTRGPDSAGLAVFSEPVNDGKRRYSLYTQSQDFRWPSLLENLIETHGNESEMHSMAGHAAIVSSIGVDEFKAWLADSFPAVHLLSVGRSIDVYKDEGHPGEISKRYEFAGMSGTHAVGHTRMATESAVSPAHAHPFTAGEDFCLVHNGTLSNPYSVRRKLEKKGIRFETDNDTEAGCRFLDWRMSEGDSLEEAITASFRELDGFFTFLMATADKMVLVRDPFACKPAVVAQTDDYIAIGSEFRALAHLPDVAHAEVFEPAPEEIYSWDV